MTVPVRYTCPHCGSVVEIERDPQLRDKSVTPDPRPGWDYAAPWEDYEAAEGIEFVCGASETDGDGCGETFYLSFLQFDDGVQIDPPLPVGDRVRFDFRT
jgi:hypothetical protein